MTCPECFEPDLMADAIHEHPTTGEPQVIVRCPGCGARWTTDRDGVLVRVEAK